MRRPVSLAIKFFFLNFNIENMLNFPSHVRQKCI